MRFKYNASLWKDDHYENIKRLMYEAAFEANINNERNADIESYPYRIQSEAWLEMITPKNVLMVISKLNEMEEKRKPHDFIVPDFYDQLYWYQIYPGSKFRSHKYFHDLKSAGKNQGLNIILKGGE
ncbi:hypothetical protein D8M09_17565 [Enterobacter sp. R1(2018)]|nr:hypothetical protein D8M09_17565 [Enterobacter sp. R1(2018)]